MNKNIRISVVLALLIILVEPVLAQYKPTYTLIKGLDVFDVKANGEFIQISERMFRVETPQGVKDLGEQRIEYNEKLEELEIQEAYPNKFQFNR
jgi:hypothetical protein